MATALEGMPPGTQLPVHLEKLVYVDHTCFDLLFNWAGQQEERGSTITVEWDGLTDRYRRPFGPRSGNVNPDQVDFPAPTNLAKF